VENPGACHRLFYQQDDAACERCLGIIDPHSAPARLIPARGPCFVQVPIAPAPAAESLWPRCAKQSVLQKGAPDAGRRVETRVQDKILPEIQRAVTACDLAYPSCWSACDSTSPFEPYNLTWPTRKVRAALWRCVAEERLLLAPLCTVGRRVPANQSNRSYAPKWEQFRRHAVAEGWFREKSPEAAPRSTCIWRRLLELPGELLDRLSSKFAEHFSGFQAFYEDQPPVHSEVEAKYKKVDFIFSHQAISSKARLYHGPTSGRRSNNG